MSEIVVREPLSLEFEEFGKIARLNRDVVITEKLDGTNSQILIDEWVGNPPGDHEREGDSLCIYLDGKDPAYRILAGSRNRWLRPGSGKEAGLDNYGFARWVTDNAEDLIKLLGVGRHYGEWWGAGVQRKYGLTAKRFSLFNVARYGAADYFLDPRCAQTAEATGGTIEHKFHNGKKMCQCNDGQDALLAEIGGIIIQPVPTLYRGPWFVREIGSNHQDINNIWAPEYALRILRDKGSIAAPGFMKPEGIVVYHEASKQLFKVTLENDEKPKGLA